MSGGVGVSLAHDLISHPTFSALLIVEVTFIDRGGVIGPLPIAVGVIIVTAALFVGGAERIGIKGRPSGVAKETC